MNSPSSHNISGLGEVWTACFQRSGGADGAIEMHYIAADQSEISTETLTVGSTLKGVLGLASIQMPDNTAGVIAYCRTAGISVGRSGTLAAGGSGNYVTAAGSVIDILAVGDRITWGNVR